MHCRHLLRVHRWPDDWRAHSAASVAAGLAAALASTPADVVKTRLMNQTLGEGSAYRGSVDCLVRTVRAEGPLALYRGFVPIWARMAPWSLTFWVSYEQVRRLAGEASF